MVIVVFFVEELFIFVKVNWGLGAVRLVMIFLTYSALKRLSSSQNLRIVIRFEFWRLNVTLYRAITIFDNYSTCVCQLRFVNLSSGTSFLALCMSRLLFLIIIWELKHLVVCTSWRYIDGCGTSLIWEHRVSIASTPYISIVGYHNLGAWNSIQLATAIY
jgi:hypothetical protein